jgi:hypothetical protein
VRMRVLFCGWLSCSVCAPYVYIDDVCVEHDDVCVLYGLCYRERSVCVCVYCMVYVTERGVCVCVCVYCMAYVTERGVCV